ncbi:MAG: TIGR04219 family outer membrane beta-barrel protein [Nitrospiraceae bacterium]|nr:TIGR04219 family outer membrane beta-barrel protein [Nitrospiraceae bacterium]
MGRYLFRFFFVVLCAFASALLCAPPSYAARIEAALGYWGQSPAGSLSYLGDTLDLRRDLDYGEQGKVQARLKVRMPAFLPNAYFMATFAKFSSRNTLSHPFTFGGVAFNGGVPFSSVLKLNQYDIAAYYSLLPGPIRDLANVEAGVNARVVDYDAQVDQGAAEVRQTATIVVPLLYTGAQFKLLRQLSVEAEARGMVFSREHYLDIIGRVKFFPVRPFFIAAGYRYDQMRLKRQDVNASLTLEGPFMEAGAEF